MTSTAPAPPTALTGLAVHEAAHVVAFAVLGLPFVDVELLGPDELTPGLVRGDPSALLARPRAYGIGLLCGIVAEARFTGQDLEVLADSCGAVDLAIAEQLMPTTAGIADRLVARAHDLVSANSLAITTAAAHLEERGRLTQAEVIEIVHAHAGRG